MRVFRVEHKQDKMGPFHNRDDEAYESLASAMCQHYRAQGNGIMLLHPEARSDGITMTLGFFGKVFACPTEEAIEHWFRVFKRSLHDLGFVLRVFECPDHHVQVGKSNKQCTFIPLFSKLVEERALITTL